MKNLRKPGISLIVLVITIIVIIILATAVIQSFSNNNPIEKAKETTFLSDIKTIEEDINIYALNKQLDDYNYDITDINLSGNEMVKEVPSTKNYKEKIEIVSGHIMLKDSITEQEKKWASKYNIQVKEYPVIPNGFVKSQATGETEVNTGLVIYEGEEAVTNTNVSTARTIRNQFVWVPVDNINEFVRESFEDTELSADYSEPYASNSIEVAEYNEMTKSIKRYGGFYIARYEASLNSSGKAQSIANQTPKDGLKWGNSMSDLSGDDAVGKSRALYPKINTTKEKDAVSTLVYGVQWDATVRFIQKKYSDILSYSGNYGNYNSGRLIKTGSNPKFAQNNIYDMCGNLMEYTMEVHSGNNRVSRGGSMSYNKDNIASRHYVDTMSSR